MCWIPLGEDGTNTHVHFPGAGGLCPGPSPGGHVAAALAGAGTRPCGEGTGRLGLCAFCPDSHPALQAGFPLQPGGLESLFPTLHLKQNKIRHPDKTALVTVTTGALVL